LFLFIIWQISNLFELISLQSIILTTSWYKSKWQKIWLTRKMKYYKRKLCDPRAKLLTEIILWCPLAETSLKPNSPSSPYSHIPCPTCISSHLVTVLIPRGPFHQNFLFLSCPLSYPCQTFGPLVFSWVFFLNVYSINATTLNLQPCAQGCSLKILETDCESPNHLPMWPVRWIFLPNWSVFLSLAA